jgi:hypothetical protein
VRRLFGEGQRRFLNQCAGMRIELDALTLLPAVAATRWRDVRVGDATLDLERDDDTSKTERVLRHLLG